MKKILSVLICLTILFGISANAVLPDTQSLTSVCDETSAYLYNAVPAPQFGSIRGEWCVLGLSAYSGKIPDEYFDSYFDAVEKYVKECNGILHDKKYTEYSRVIIALTSIGKNPTAVAGFNLLLPLGDYEKTVFQGINGSIWALIALDCGNYQIPFNAAAKTAATREMYIEHILKSQAADGGWGLSGKTSDPDITAMALQALSRYRDRNEVDIAVSNALSYLSAVQDEDGGFSSGGTKNSESCAQVLIALSSLEISVNDSRFVKSRKTVLDKLLTYRESGGGFKHIEDGAVNQMATEQCFCALVALNKFDKGENSLYNISNFALSDTDKSEFGLEGKNPDVSKSAIVNLGKSFSDTVLHKNEAAISALAERGIINGKSSDLFDPNGLITRAEFSAVVVRGLGLPQKSGVPFCDVTTNDWFYNAVSTAHFYGIVNGISDFEFCPDKTITREEAAVMLTRAAKLCGIDTDISVSDIPDSFNDSDFISDWAREAVAFCLHNKILFSNQVDLKPQAKASRAEVAQMLYNMLLISNLI